MSKGTKILLISILAFTAGIYYLFFSNSRENKLVSEGNSIVSKIENYKRVNNRLPSSLEDVGIRVKDESDPPLYYEKRSGIHYTLSFGTSLGESKIYYSDSKKWEDFYREIDTVR